MNKSSNRFAVAPQTIKREAGLNRLRRSWTAANTLLVHELFENHVQRTPHATAVVHEKRAFTYAELNAQSNQLARLLRNKGVGPEQRVAIAIERGFDMVMGLLGILKAGGAYVPLDPSYPRERLQHMLADAEPNLVLTQESLLSTLPRTQVESIALDSSRQEIAGYAKSNLRAPELRMTGQNLIYVIYTSGSTGRPKGTEMCHQSMANLIEWHRGSFPDNEGARVLQFAALSFDVAFQEIFSTLCTGGTLVLLDEWIRRDARALGELLNSENVHRLFIPPLMLQSLAESARTSASVPASLQDVITAGEQLRISAEISAFFKRLPGCRLHNHYGPTETHVVTALTLSGDPGRWPALPSIGSPILNSQIHILDGQRRPVPAGTVGEIYIGGTGVARGYLRRPELTAQRFILDPFAAAARMYVTGDLGRLLVDGTIEYLGRNDDQVKVRGHRVELGEILSALTNHEQVKEAAVIAREDIPGDKRIVAYITSRDGNDPSVECLRVHLRAALPEYMVPSAFVILERLPLSPIGKLDRGALPPPEAAAYANREYQAPQDDLETTLAAIWQELIHAQRVGRHDNFFELGGDSLSIVRMMERLREVGLSVDARSVYASPTLAELAQLLRWQATDTFEVPPNLIPQDCQAITPQMLPLVSLDATQIDLITQSVRGGAANIQDIYPLAPLQEGLLFHHLFNERGADTYVVPILLSLSSRSALDGFVHAVQQVVDRHDILRTAMLWERLPQGVQVVCRSVSVPMEEVSLDPQRAVCDQLAEWVQPGQQQLELRQAPLLRLRTAADPNTGEWYVLMQLHHLACDHESLETMLKEMMTLMAGHGETLPEPAPYRNHVARTLADARNNDAEAFFRSKLADIDEPTAPFGLVDVHGDSQRIVVAHEELDPELAQRIRTQARRLETTPATLFHAAWSLVVAHTSGRDDVVFGSLLSGRLQESVDTQHMLGIFINTLPLRLRLRGLSAGELVAQTQREVVALLVHEQASLADAQRCSGVDRSQPLFSSLLNYLHSSIDLQVDQPWLQQGVRVLALKEWTNYPVTVSVDDRATGFLVMAQTDRRIQPQRLIGYLKTALQSLANALEKAPRTPALALPILPEDERHTLLKEFNETRAEAPAGQLIHELFEAQVGRRPDAVAVVGGERSVTYAELNGRVNQLAHYLTRSGVQIGERIPVLMPRCLQLLVAQLAILKSGAVYVPVDLTLPAERQHFMIRDCDARRILSDHRAPSWFRERSMHWIDCSAMTGAILALPINNPGISMQALQPAYVLYTSGSTGKPKGVVVPHRAVLRLVINSDYVRIEATDVVAHCSNPAFDAATFEIWSALLNGASIVVVSREVLLDVERFAELLQQRRVSVLFLTTALFNQHAGAPAGLFAGIRYVLFGGEAGDANVVRNVLRTHPPQHLLNMYGPTETTTFATSYEVNAVAHDASSLPIGRPISNTQVYILDNRLQPVPLGVVGQLYIGGTGVALGYLNRPALTAERFIADPFSADPGARLYSSGDLARWRADGQLDFLGRNDQQVKLRGFRIELGEIEAQLARHEQVKDAAVLVREDARGEKQLVAYITRSRCDLNLIAIRRYLHAALPKYMVPAAFIVVERLPLTSNGKLDRRALPAPELGAYATRQYTAPDGAAEETIARIWQSLLNVERVGRDDSFFELGGHSLLALKLLFEIGQSLGCSLKVTDVYGNPTLRGLAARIHNGTAEDEVVDLSREATLDAGIVALPRSSQSASNAVLLTGATGFVGRFLLAQLLEDTDATVYCLIRASSEQEAFSRLRTMLTYWNLWRDEFAGRIVAVTGDLRLARLGIDEATYKFLSQRIGSIYHCATSMNHLETYEMAKAANVGVATQLLRLAVLETPKVINYISTLGVFSSIATDGARVVSESSSIDHEMHRSSHGYEASKWVAERIFMTAGERGIPCNIFRLGLVWADSNEGRYDELQHEYRVIKSCLLSGCGIENYLHLMPPTPVDYVARAVVWLATHHEDGEGIFHISSSTPLTGGFFERSNSVSAQPLALVPFYDWVHEMKRHHQDGWSLPIVPLIEFAFSMDEASLAEHQRDSRPTNLLIDCTRTRRELEQAGIVAPVLDDDLIRAGRQSMLARDLDLR